MASLVILHCLLLVLLIVGLRLAFSQVLHVLLCLVRLVLLAQVLPAVVVLLVEVAAVPFIC